MAIQSITYYDYNPEVLNLPDNYLPQPLPRSQCVVACGGCWNAGAGSAAEAGGPWPTPCGSAGTQAAAEHAEMQHTSMESTKPTLAHVQRKRCITTDILFSTSVNHTGYNRIKLHHNQENIKALETVQRWASRWVQCHCRYTSSIDLMIQSLNWPSLQEHKRTYTLCDFYKFHHNLVILTCRT